jgi:predicted transcriptional regulator
MSRPKSRVLTEGELRVMRVLWDRGDSSVGEVMSALRERPRRAYNTVLTVLHILERKRYVKHRRAGRAFVYSPLIDRTRARRRALDYLISRFFDGSPNLLALNLLQDEELSPETVKLIKQRIEDAP